MGLANIKSWFNAYYDKLLSFAALLLLLVSLVYLAYSVGTLKEEQARFEREQQMLRPRYPKAAPPDLNLFEEGIFTRGEPYQVAAMTNHLMTPERRVSCVNCDRPIAYAATICPYCLVAQPDNVGATPDGDRDNDGLPDVWEIKYGLNPLQASDALLDTDNDGFTNIEEYPDHSPADPKDHPTLIGKMRCVGIKELPFDLVFKGVSKNSNGELIFQLNLRRNEKTFFKKLTEEANGFKLIEYDPAWVDGKKKLQVLTLKRGDKLIRLIKLSVVPWNEYEAKLAYDVDNTTMDVRIDSEFALGTEKYRVKQIDSGAKRVLIRDISGGKETWVGQRATGDKTSDPGEQKP